ncbi:TPA: hypothetical protein GXZ54_04875 [bacterium]|nr:hypothetical protein [bacterium]
MKIKKVLSKILNNELYYSIFCIIAVSIVLLFGICWFIPRYSIFAFFALLLTLTILIIFYFWIRYGSHPSRLNIDEKYYTMQIRRLNRQLQSGYINKEQYEERVIEFENKIKKQ